MKTFLTVLSLCIAYVSFASHHFGGYIVAKQLNGRNYQITTFLLSDPNSPANSSTGSISLDFGDGKTETIQRSAISSEDGVQRNTYVTEHLYATDGLFNIQYSDPNFPANIVNLNGGFSDNTPFKTSCLIKVNTIFSGVKSASPLAFEFIKGRLNETMHYNPTFVGGDGNTVKYELASKDILFPNYIIPEESSINPYSGMLTFTPKSLGLYLFVIRVSTYQHDVLIAQSDVIQLTRILDAVTAAPTVDMPDVTSHPQGWKSRELIPNQSVTQLATFTQMHSSFSVEVYTELFDKGATSSITKPTNTSSFVELNWTALPVYARTTPYFITYRFRRSPQNMIDDYTVAFYHGAPINTGMNDPLASNESILIYPNPVWGGQCFFVFRDFQHAQLSVYDALGRMIISESVTGKSISLETSTWKSGIYTYTLQLENGELKNGKLAVE